MRQGADAGEGDCTVKERLYRFMQGRYGQDSLGKFMSAMSLVFVVISLFTGWMAFYILAMALITLGFYRMFSRNHWQRSRENQAFLRLRGMVTGRFNGQKTRFRQSKTHRVYKCPSCKTQCRVPRGRGHIRITCPSCRTVFEKNT